MNNPIYPSTDSPSVYRRRFFCKKSHKITPKCLIDSIPSAHELLKVNILIYNSSGGGGWRPCSCLKKNTQDAEYQKEY